MLTIYQFLHLLKTYLISSPVSQLGKQPKEGRKGNIYENRRISEAFLYKILPYLPADMPDFLPSSTTTHRLGETVQCTRLPEKDCCQPRWLSGLRRSHVHSLVFARRSLCPEKLRSNPGQHSKEINFSGWHGLDMTITVTKRR